MANIVEEANGFKVIEVSRQEIVSKLGKYGAVGICDYCGKSHETGYYVAVLNHWLCPECYNDFLSRNNPEPEDSWFENQMYNQYKQIFDV